MQIKALFRSLMIVAGITATLAIVLSNALPEISGNAIEKAKTEQTESGSDARLLAAPSDGVPGGITQVNDVDRSLLETILIEEIEVADFECYATVLSGYLNVLFSAIISPNAP